MTCAKCNAPVHAKGLCSHHYNTAYYAANREREKERAMRWHYANPDKAAAARARRDPERLRQYARAAYWRDPLRGIANYANWRAAKFGIVGRVTAEGLRSRIEYFGGRCWICGGPNADSIDHVISMGRGGPNLHSNIRPAHLGCNCARAWDGKRERP